MPEHTFDSILDALDAQRQRATYSAVAGVLGTSPRGLMSGKPRDRRHSWIVSKGTGQPTGYPPDQVHPDLESRPEVLVTHQQLAQWMSQAGVAAG